MEGAQWRILQERHSQQLLRAKAQRVSQDIWVAMLHILVGDTHMSHVHLVERGETRSSMNVFR